ncbi:MAG: IS1634 family transposase [Campylobacterales bacterium]|nr:IS1634 family transposase [Campylobacterales bacterium]
MSLHIRQKKNSSGTISIQIIDRVDRKYKVIETIACVKNELDLQIYLDVANKRLEELIQQMYPTLFDENKNEELTFIELGNNDLIPIGDELIYGKLFERLGCSVVDLDYKRLQMFKNLVVSRLLYPGSKLYLIDYLEYFKKESIDKNAIYRFLDTLYEENLKLQIEKCVFDHTYAKMNQTIAFTFYDVTTLYFESESEDDLRRIGFSKEGKLARPQIQLGLFTTLQGYPLSFEVYEGNKYEGHTLVDVLKKFQDKFQLKNKPVVVADRGMLNNNNLAYLENNGYKYILAAKIKNISNDLKEQISNLVFLNDGVTHTLKFNKDIPYTDDKDVKKSLNINQRLVLSYSTSRAKKDKYNRDKALERLKKKIESSKAITKKDLKLSYYAKYLNLDDHKCDITFNINDKKVDNDAKLDGIKGFITNDFTLTPNEIIEHYNNQYAVEQAFRISKTDLKIRPIYHRLETRIKAHILISFVSYAIFKEFDSKLKENDIKFKFSQKLLRDIIKHMFALRINGKLVYLKFDEIQQQVYDAIKNS